MSNRFINADPLTEGFPSAEKVKKEYEGELEIRPEDFERFYGACVELVVIQGSDLYGQFVEIVESLGDVYGGKPFYKGNSEEMLYNFYQGCANNIGTLNSFYSKFLEYLEFVSEQLGMEDERLGKIINGVISAPRGE